MGLWPAACLPPGPCDRPTGAPPKRPDNPVLWSAFSLKLQNCKRAATAYHIDDVVWIVVDVPHRSTVVRVCGSWNRNSCSPLPLRCPSVKRCHRAVCCGGVRPWVWRGGGDQAGRVARPDGRVGQQYPERLNVCASRGGGLGNRNQSRQIPARQSATGRHRSEPRQTSGGTVLPRR